MHSTQAGAHGPQQSIHRPQKGDILWTSRLEGFRSPKCSVQLLSQERMKVGTYVGLPAHPALLPGLDTDSPYRAAQALSGQNEWSAHGHFGSPVTVATSGGGQEPVDSSHPLPCMAGSLVSTHSSGTPLREGTRPEGVV